MSAVLPLAAPKRKVTGGKVAQVSAEESANSPTVHSENDEVSSEGGQPLTTSPLAVAHVAPRELTVHPELGDVAELSELEAAQLEESIREAGRVLQPILINSRKEILDGRNRRNIAEKLNLPTVPVTVDDGADALVVAISSALDRRHLSQGQRALYIYKLYRPLRTERATTAPDMKLRREAGGHGRLHAGPVDPYEHVSYRELSRRYNVSKAFFTYLAQMWHNSTAEEWTSIVRRIETGEGELAQIYKGFCGKVLTKGSPRPPETVEKHITRLTGALNSMGQQAKHWDDFDSGEQGRIKETLADSLAKMSPDFVAAIIKIGGEVLKKQSPVT